MPDKESPEYISVKYSYPLWIVKMWLAQYDFDTVEMVCSAGNRAPDVCIAANTLKTNTEELKKQLNEIGISTENGYYIDSAVHIKGSSDLSETESFIKGMFHVQDESSMLAVSVLDPKPGETVLDVCAAPGDLYKRQLLMKTIIYLDFHALKNTAVFMFQHIRLLFISICVR